MKILFILLLGLLWSVTNIPQTQAQLNYSEKKNSNQQQTSSGATRGCRKTLPKLQLLAPSDEIAQIGEEQTFLLNLSELSPYPLKISILEPYVPESLWSTQLRPTKSGLLKVSLPKTVNLKPHQEYIFTATIPCDPNSPSSSIYVRALFQKNPLLLPSDLSGRSERSSGTVRSRSGRRSLIAPQKRISRLLEQGIWYDALWISYQYQLPEFKQLLEQQGIELEDSVE